MFAVVCGLERSKHMSWNYRLIKHVSDGTLAIHEVYYDEAGNITAIAENPAVVLGDTVEEIIRVLDKMAEAHTKEFISSDYFLLKGK
jgi:hypothetical protein